MENKINVAELLKDCPKGMELDCTICNNVVTLEGVDTVGYYPIRITSKDGFNHVLTHEGCIYKREDAKCVIFPKGKTTWEGFTSPCEFKEGDVVVSVFDDIHLLRTEDSSYCAYRVHWTELSKLDNTITTGVKVARLATEEEKQKLFDAIKAKGYKWNKKTKTLEKLVEPKFKVGDRIIKRDSIANSWIVSSVSSEYYGLKLPSPNGGEGIGVLPISEQDEYELVPDIKPKFKVGDRIRSIISNSGYIYNVIEIKESLYVVSKNDEDDNKLIDFKIQDCWELVPNKFDITTLKPFDKVLVRHNKDNKWCGSFFSHIDKDLHSNCYKFVTIAGKSYPMMIPCEGNEYLLGKTDDCEEYYKIWE